MIKENISRYLSYIEDDGKINLMATFTEKR
jgi:hypothetical protein